MSRQLCEEHEPTCQIENRGARVPMMLGRRCCSLIASLDKKRPLSTAEHSLLSLPQSALLGAKVAGL